MWLIARALRSGCFHVRPFQALPMGHRYRQTPEGEACSEIQAKGLTLTDKLALHVPIGGTEEDVRATHESVLCYSMELSRATAAAPITPL